MEENEKQYEEVNYQDNPDAVQSDNGSKYSWGFYVLVGAAFWAVFELIDAILFFF